MTSSRSALLHGIILSMFDVIASRQFQHDLVMARAKSCNPWHFSCSFVGCPPFCIVNSAYKINTLNDGRKMESASPNGCHKSNVKCSTHCWSLVHDARTILNVCDVCLSAVRAAKNHRRAVNFYDRTGTKKKTFRIDRVQINSLLNCFDDRPNGWRCARSLLFTFLIDKLLLLPVTPMEAAAAAIKRIHIFRGTAAYTFRPSPRYPRTDLCKIL